MKQVYCDQCDEYITYEDQEDLDMLPCNAAFCPVKETYNQGRDSGDDLHELNFD